MVWSFLLPVVCPGPAAAGEGAGRGQGGRRGPRRRAAPPRARPRAWRPVCCERERARVYVCEFLYPMSLVVGVSVRVFILYAVSLMPTAAGRASTGPSARPRLGGRRGLHLQLRLARVIAPAWGSRGFGSCAARSPAGAHERPGATKADHGPTGVIRGAPVAFKSAQVFRWRGLGCRAQWARLQVS